MTQIKFAYAGFISFASKIFSVLTGLIFTLTVTRRLSTSDFGVWTLIGYLASYFTWPSWITRFWATRYTARNVVNAPKTAIMTNLMISTVIALAYLPLGAYIAHQTGADRTPFMLYGLFVFLSPIEDTLESVAQAKRPQAIGFAFVFYETTKVICGFLLVASLRLGLVGATLSVLLALTIQISSLLTRLFDLVFNGRFELGLARRWMRHGWLGVYNNLPGVLSGLDRFVIVTLAGASISIAYLGAVTTLSTAISYTSSLAIALYPRLLSGGGERDIDRAFRMVLMFLIPASLGIFWLSEPSLALFRQEYVVARLCLYFFVSASFLSVLENIVNTSLMGTEMADTSEKVSFKDFRNSRLFRLPTINLISLMFYLPAVVVLSLVYHQDQLWLANAWSLLILGTQIAVLAAKLVYARRSIQLKIPVFDTLKFVLSSLIMIFIVSIVWRGGDYSDPIFLLISGLTPTIVAGVASYFSTLYLIDREFRRVVTRIIKNLRHGE